MYIYMRLPCSHKNHFKVYLRIRVIMHILHNNSMCVSLCLHVSNITCYIHLFICVCLVLSKTPIKLYSQRQLLRNNNYNSFCIFICICLVLSKTPIQHLVDITNIACYVYL